MNAFLAGISVVCFAASYAVAWGLELSRLAFRSGVRGALMLGFAGAGLLAHTLYLGYRALDASGSPLSSSYDWYLVAAWLLAVAYLYLTYYHPHTAVGLFVLPLVLLLIAAADGFADRQPMAADPASRVWSAIHGVFLLLGTVAVMIGFAAGLMYLVQADRLKRKRPPLEGLRLPSLEWLEKVNSRATVISAILVAVGFLAGIVLKVAGDRSGGGLAWSDPVVWSSGLMLGWLVAAALFNMLYKPARHGRKVAYLTVASFGFLSLALGVFLLVESSHGKKRTQLGTAGSNTSRAGGVL